MVVVLHLPAMLVESTIFRIPAKRSGKARFDECWQLRGFNYFQADP